jgi:hypothetical protein
MERFDDDYGSLGAYFGEFSMVGNRPNSLRGYGFSAAVAPAPATAPASANLMTPVVAQGRGLLPPQGKEAATVIDPLGLMQDGAAIRVSILQGLLRGAGGADASLKSNRWDSNTLQAWKNIFGFSSPESSRVGAATKWQASPLPGQPKTRVTVSDWAWVPAAALEKLKVRVVQLAAARSKTSSAPAPAPRPASAPTGLDMTATTNDIQSILKRLGAPSERLSDGLFGSTTKGFWEESAKKRGKNPAIAAKSGARLKEVLVNKAAYLAIKTDADAKTPPVPGSATPPEPLGGSLKQMDQSLVLGVTPQELAILVDRLVPGKGEPTVRYETAANARKLDPRIEQDGARYLVIKATLAALTQAFQAAGPPPSAQPTEEANIQTAMGSIAKAATASVLFSAVKTAVAASKISELSFLLKLAPQRDAVWQTAWARFLAPMLSAQKNVNVTPAMAQAVTAASVAYQQAAAGEVARIKDFTEVNASDVIARINGLGITVKKFDRAGGYKELADAIKTFLENSKISVPGDTVRTDAKGNAFVNNTVMQKLAAAVVAAQNRANMTKSFRDRMVSSALKESSAVVPVMTLQQALRHAVLSGQAGTFTALYGAVNVTGAFDAPTRAAYTEIARTLTIGPAVQQYQTLLQQQLGPNFKMALVEEARNQVWNTFLDQAVVTRDGKLSISMLPTIAVKLSSSAALYQKNVSVDTRHQEQVAEQNKMLASAIAKSNAIVSIVNVQQALLQMIASKNIDAVSDLRITGVSDKSTNDGLFKLSSLIFPEGFSVPETFWAAYLKAVGYVVTPGQPVKRGWIGANYIALPPALANSISTRAGEWIARHGASNIQVVQFNNPSIVTVKMPPPQETKVTFDAKEEAKKLIESPAPAAKDGAAEQAAALKGAQDAAARERAARLAAEQAAAEAQRRAQLAANEAEKERAAAAAAAAASREAAAAAQQASLREQAARDAGRADIAEREAAEARRATLVAQEQAQAAQEAVARQRAAQEEQTAENQVALPAHTPPMQAGVGGGGGMAMVAAALVGLALLATGSKNKDEPYR